MVARSKGKKTSASEAVFNVKLASGLATRTKKKAAEVKIPIKTKTARTTKGLKKSSKAAAEEEDETIEENVPAIVQKPGTRVTAVSEKKTNSRKQKADKPEDIAAPVLKKQKTKAAHKETLDSAGVAEDPTSSTNIRLTPPQRLLCLEAFYKNKNSYKLALNDIRAGLGTTSVPTEQYVLDLIKQFKETYSILQ